MEFLDPEYRDLGSDQLSELDVLCGRYERERLAGQTPSIEAFVAAAPESLRVTVELELIRIELEILVSWHQSPSLAEFARRFPRWAQVLDCEWSQWTAQPNTARGLLDSATSDTHLQPSQRTCSPTPSSPSLAVPSGGYPDLSARFRIVRKLAEGGIGTVYVAWDEELRREVALKELRGSMLDQPSLVHRFLAEATITGGLEHPQIVPVYAVGRRPDGRYFYAMRLVPGRSLQVAIQELHRTQPPAKRLTQAFRSEPNCRDLLQRFVAVCRAIGFAHSRGVIHRDLKPGNIMVGDFGETLVVDWGLAKKIDQPPSGLSEGHSRGQPPAARSAHATQVGAVIGTPGFMSPEQAAGWQEEVGPASDIYSLGATLLAVLTNQVPTDHPSKEIAERIAEAPQPDAVARHHQWLAPYLRPLPRPLAAICARALALQPHDRYPSAIALAADVEAYLADQPVSVLAEPVWTRTRRWLLAHPRLTGSLLGGIALAVVSLVTISVVLSRANGHLRVAREQERAAAEMAQQQTERARVQSDAAERQRRQIQQIVQSLTADVSHGIENVSGGAGVRRQVLAQALTQLGKLSTRLQADHHASLSTAIALADLSDLFRQFGSEPMAGMQIQGQTIRTPLEAAERLLEESLAILNQLDAEKPSGHSADVAIEELARQRTAIQAKLLELRRQQAAP